MFKALSQMLKLESASGLLLMGMAGLALIVANSPLYPVYHDFFNNAFSIEYIPLRLEQPLLFWINDGLMAIFFFLIGLEIKREWLGGHLARPSQRVLPLIATLGGVLVPALIYLLFNYDHPVNRHGFAIPTATDIAFALGVLSLFARNVPRSLKVFLLTIAVLDDLSAVLMIAIFYATQLSFISFILALLTLIVLIILNRMNIKNISVYLVGTLVLWAFVLNSGIHATVAGVFAAFTVPLQSSEKSPLLTLEAALHPWVAYLILPIFAFANAGVPFNAIDLKHLLSPLSLGIILGLFLGKQLGIFSGTYLAVKLKLCKLPDQITWPEIYSVSVFCGIGFTMSLFIGTLAFQGEEVLYSHILRMGVLIASLCSTILGSLAFMFATLNKKVT